MASNPRSFYMMTDTWDDDFGKSCPAPVGCRSSWYNPTMTRAGFVVSLASAIRPVLRQLNQELASRNARAVSKEEWPELDTILHEGHAASIMPGTRCSYCGGYLSTDADGEFTCLNCARSAIPRRELGELVEELASSLIEYRSRQA